MATTNWESSLPVFSSSDRTTFTQRSSVSGDDKVKWIASHKYETLAYFKMPSPDGKGEGYDCWWSFNYINPDGQQYSHVIGCTLNWPQFEAETTDLGKWIRQGYDVLMPLAHSPYENDVMSVWSFDAAVDMLHGAEQLLHTWAPMVNQWAGDIAAPGADWTGTAAGQFKTMLSMFGAELEDLAKDVHDRDAAGKLKAARESVGTAVLAMWNAQENYRNSRNAWPVNPLHDALLEGMSTAKVTATPTLVPNLDGGATTYGVPDFVVTTAWGDPHGDDFWKKAEQRAKEIWLKNVADILDPGVKTAFDSLDKGYVPAIKALNDPVRTVQMRRPYTPPADTPPGVSDPTSDVNKQLSDMNKNMNDSLNSLNKGMNDNFNTMAGGLDKNLKDTLGGGPGSLGGGSSGVGGGGSGFPGLGGGGGVGGGGSGFPGVGGGGGSGVPVLDQNGKQIFDANGNPVNVPPGSHIDPTTHQVIGPDGRPVLGPDGKPITVPDGATVGTGPGDHMKVPPGSHIDESGRVIGPDGKPVLDGNGNPVVVDPGSRIDSDGTLLDPDGKPISELSQLLADQRHAVNAGIDGGGGDGLLGGDGFRSGTYHPSGSPFGGSSGDSDGLGVGGFPGTGLLPGGRSGMSSKAMAAGGDPNTAQARAAAEAADAAEKAAAAKAAAEAEKNALTGKNVPTTGGMPPMMPPGAGAGAPNQKDKDRQRTTWLAEEEEVWGTESTAVSGVIGR